MDLPHLVVFALSLPLAAVVVVALGKVLHYDWRKASDYGLTRAEPAPPWAFVVFIGRLIVLFLVGALSRA